MSKISCMKIIKDDREFERMSIFLENTCKFLFEEDAVLVTLP